MHHDCRDIVHTNSSYTLMIHSCNQMGQLVRAGIRCSAQLRERCTTTDNLCSKYDVSRDIADNVQYNNNRNYHVHVHTAIETPYSTGPNWNRISITRTFYLWSVSPVSDMYMMFLFSFIFLPVHEILSSTCWNSTWHQDFRIPIPYYYWNAIGQDNFPVHFHLLKHPSFTCWNSI